MAPLVQEFNKHQDRFITRVCVTAQHREMLDQVLEFFEITPDYDLDLMKPNQNLYGLTSDIILGLKPILEEFEPDFVYVHGDTTTTMASSIAAFYKGCQVCHVEAGLRTFNMQSPFPEELNRCITGVASSIHFAPTEVSRKNLLNENKKREDILVSGNTVIDALKFGVKKVDAPSFKNESIDYLRQLVNPKKKTILVTGHRRENHGQGFINICKALKLIAEEHPETQIIYPVHLNPKVQQPVYDLLSATENINLIAPLSYPSFIWLMNRSYLIITDSGGVQEEAPSLGKPVLVMRNTTERPEAVEAGTVLLVGTDTDKIVHETKQLLENEVFYNQMKKKHNPYGDGLASTRIVEFIIERSNGI